MSGRFSNKVAVVTSSTRGIGFATVRRLAQEGAKVVMCSRKEENVRRAIMQLKKEGLDVHGIVCHVGKNEDIKRLIQEAVSKYGGIDILIPMAGVSTMYGPVLDTTEEEYNKMFDINVKAPFMIIKEAFPFMSQRGGGNIVLMSSYAAYVPQYTNVQGCGIDIYCICKAAILSMTKALVSQLSLHNIRINCVAPGPIETRFFNGMTSRMETLNLHRDYESRIPMQRRGTPEEVAAVITFLASDDASYITGENIPVAGGLESRL